MTRQVLCRWNLANVDETPNSHQVDVTAPAIGAANCISACPPRGLFVLVPAVSMEQMATVQSAATLLMDYLVLTDRALAVVLEDDGSRRIQARSE